MYPDLIRSVRRLFLALLLACLLPACRPPPEPAPAPTEPPPEPEPPREMPAVSREATRETSPDHAAMIAASDFSYGYLPSGYLQASQAIRPDLFHLETGHYGLVLDLNNLPEARAGRWKEPAGMAELLHAGPGPVSSLPKAELAIELIGNGKTFRARRSGIGPIGNDRRLEGLRFWEWGRYVHHLDLQDLVFEDDEGQLLPTRTDLDLVAWPRALTMTARVTPTLAYRDGSAEGVSGFAHRIVNEPIKTPPELTGLDPVQSSIEFWVKVPEKVGHDRSSGYLFCMRNDKNPNNGYFLRLMGHGTVLGRIRAGGTSRKVYSIDSPWTAFRREQWNHIALTFADDAMVLYINGHEQKRTLLDEGRVPADGTVYLGTDGKEKTPILPADFDEVRIWNRVLTPEDIRKTALRRQPLRDRTGLVFEATFDDKPPPPEKQWNNITLRMQLKTESGTWEKSLPVSGAWKTGEEKSLTLQAFASGEEWPRPDLAVDFKSPDGKDVPVSYDPAVRAYVADVKRFKRPWKAGYAEIRDYDEFPIRVNNPTGDAVAVPFLLRLLEPANITGLCPILCDTNGVPTGLHVQITKNWHEPALGSYLRAYTLLPAAAGTSEYLLRIPYGFYGSLPMASHSPLSLVGWGGNGRWDQLAIGCWGETFCLNVDRTSSQAAITDVRMLMARQGTNAQAWTWTDAGWGGDWLTGNNEQGEALFPGDLKASYLAHGPCLTDVRYAGSFGPEREVTFEARVHTPRSDDYARTFLRLRYDFRKPVPTEGTWLFRVGRNRDIITPSYAYGNATGLVASADTPRGLTNGMFAVRDLDLPGAGPWWATLPGIYLERDNRLTGYSALIIRGYRASLGGTLHERPTLSLPASKPGTNGMTDLDIVLGAPAGVASFQPGDFVEMDLEWITLQNRPDDYYGPNEAYRAHLKEHPGSWKTTYREAAGNNLKVSVRGGTLLSSYPVFVRAGADSIQVEIEGGVGQVPIRFEGLPHPRYVLLRDDGQNYHLLDQDVHGNDSWQTDRDPETGLYAMSFNIPLDGLDRSTWVLKPVP